MMDALNTRAAQVVAGGLTLFVVGIGAWVWVTFASLLGWLIVLNLFLGSFAFWCWVSVSIKRKYHAPVVIYDKGEKRARVVDGLVLPLPAYPSSLTNLSLHHEALPALPAGDLAEAGLTVDALPDAPNIFQVLPQLQEAGGRILLGYDAAGQIWVEVNDLLIVAMAGNSGRGKSKALLFLILQLLRQQASGVRVSLLDGKGDLRRWLSQYQPVAYSPAEVEQTVEALLSEADWRLQQASNNVAMTFPPLLVVLDELDLLIGRYERVVELVELLTKKTRSVNMHGIYSNQSLPAELLGGVRTRGVIVSRICFYCDDEAAALLGVRENNGGKALLQRLAPPEPPGLALVRTAAFGWKILAFPYTPDGAVHHMLRGIAPASAMAPAPLAVAQPAPSSTFSPPLSPTLPRPSVVRLSAEEREKQRVLEMHQKYPDAKPYELCGLLGVSNNRWRRIEQIITEAEEEAQQTA